MTYLQQLLSEFKKDGRTFTILLGNKPGPVKILGIQDDTVIFELQNPQNVNEPKVLMHWTNVHIYSS